ncbi:MAG: hypothetical protein SV377_05020 [Halobacteria archaeon]|nr:hypothetical protein [Halobacteria archaeon]
MNRVSQTIRGHILDSHRGTVETLIECADEASDEWDGDFVSQRSRVVSPLETRLRDRGSLRDLSIMIEEVADVAELNLQASPVPGPPYVTVTSLGPVLRGTCARGRIIVRFRLFDLRREGENVYVRGSNEPEEVVEVEFRPGSVPDR